MVRVLVTGASGFVGTKLVEMAPDDWEMVCVGRTPIAGCSQFIRCDLSNSHESRSVAEKLNGKFDAIIHLAAYVPKTADDDHLHGAVAGNIESTTNLLQYFGGLTSKIIIGSTAEVYDQSKINGLISEDNHTSPTSYYGATKLGSEFIAISYAHKMNKQLTILRFSIMYGGFDPISRALPNFIRSAKSNEPIVVKGANILRDYVHIYDVVESIKSAIILDGAGVLNIGTGKGVSVLEAAKKIVELAESDSLISVDQDAIDTGSDIVMNIKKARQTIGYDPKIFFPDKLKEIIDLYE